MRFIYICHVHVDRKMGHSDKLDATKLLQLVHADQNLGNQDLYICELWQEYYKTTSYI